ncbi:MAG: hypothetical protein M3139_04705, partial [Bacteroidota bacterium]|nr:hypothetical protein [Bacteroidota bacterium]
MLEDRELAEDVLQEAFI